MCAAEGTGRRLPGPAGTRFAAVRWFEEIDSTNRWLADEARAGAPEGAVAAARWQTAGRGRLGRRWEAPPGANLLVSVLLRPTYGAAAVHRSAAAVSLAAADACAEVAGVAPGCKWPNDLVVGDRKLAGVLAEVVADPGGVLAEGRPCALVVGIGLNVHWPPPDAGGAPGPPADADGVLRTATSLWREGGARAAAVTPAQVLASLLASLERRLAAVEGDEGPAALDGEYRRRCVTLGRAVRVIGGTQTVEGRAVDLTEAGHLVVEVGGRRVTVAAGDVVHLRHAG